MGPEPEPGKMDPKLPRYMHIWVFFLVKCMQPTEKVAQKVCDVDVLSVLYRFPFCIFNFFLGKPNNFLRRLRRRGGDYLGGELIPF